MPDCLYLFELQLAALVSITNRMAFVDSVAWYQQ